MMKIETHQINDMKIAEVTCDKIIINSTQDGVDLLGDLYYQGFDKIIVCQENITPDFFALENGMAGEILQKFSNFRVKFAIIGDFSKYITERKSIRDFIYECNKGKQVNFINTLNEGLVF